MYYRTPGPMGLSPVMMVFYNHIACIKTLKKPKPQCALKAHEYEHI